MGGHGGLNILPQKKWNVYNHDNRAIVERDKRQAEAQKRAAYERQREGMLQGKMDVLKQERGIEVTNDNKEKQAKFVSSLNQEFSSIGHGKHINLFEQEQKLIENQQLLQMRRMKESQFLKDKNMDYSSKFLGTYAQGSKAAPWYARQKGYVESKRSKPLQLEELVSVRKSDSLTTGEVVKLERGQRCSQKVLQKRKEKKERERSRSRSREKDHIKQQKSQMDILREKRLKRQQKEREKALRIKQISS